MSRTPTCPVHGVPLIGGDIQFMCPEGPNGWHNVFAADLNREYRAVTR